MIIGSAQPATGPDPSSQTPTTSPSSSGMMAAIYSPMAAPGSPVQAGGSAATTPVASLHARLQLKQIAIDTWSIKELLGLASAVLRSGDQNWVSVSRQMKPFAEALRPSDWFSQKNCALQYNLLLEKAEQQADTPRRGERSKRGGGGGGSSDEGTTPGSKSLTVQTPGEAIVKRLTAERMTEIRDQLAREGEEIKKLEAEVELLSGKDDVTDEMLDQIQAEIDEELRAEEERQAAHAQWLASREEKKQAIQAALKWNSSKLPLKGAAAAAAAAAAPL